MTHPVDLHVGARIRLRRRLLGITQQGLADSLGVTFQQVQKYERGANRVSASRLWLMARLLGVPVAFFFEGLPPAGDAPAGPAAGAAEMPLDGDAAALLRSFCAIPPEQRRRLLELARTLSDPAA